MPDSPPESRIDVRLLGAQQLPRAEFPGGKGEVFRVFFAPAVHEALWKHGSEDTSVEICGVLVGTWERDGNGPFVRITESIRGEAADNKFAEVTFTHETWAKINARMDSAFAHLSIVGWYHTHPDFGIFLSDRDRFIHEHFFSGAGQIAHVIDPVRKNEGVFVWRDGKPTLADYYWVGDRLIHESGAGKESAPPAQPGQGAPSPASPPPPSGASWTTQLMAYFALFLLGYVLAGFRSYWEDQMLREGAVYHFGIWKGLKPGLREELDMVGRDLTVIARAVKAHDSQSPPAKPGGSKDGDVTTAQILDGINAVGKHVEAIKSVYGFTDTEQDAVRHVLNRAEGLVRRREEEPPAPAEKTPAEAGRETRKDSSDRKSSAAN